MTYELAKKLKDAGFPQQHERYDDGRFCVKCGDSSDPNYKDSYGKPCTPSLSELIEACGDAFTYKLLGKDGDNWAVGEVDTAYGAGVFESEYLGSTPEEAVANLWLSLNSTPNLLN